jgi:hypothetical protein
MEGDASRQEATFQVEGAIMGAASLVTRTIPMVDPRQQCAVEPMGHAKRRFLERGLSQPDLERMIRRGAWVAEGGAHYDLVYRDWHFKVKLLRCLIRVKTAFEE